MSEHSSKEWNYHPDVPLADPSIFKWPPSPQFLATWFARNWLTLSERVMMVLVAIGCWIWLYPSLTQAKTLAFGWVFQVWLVNMGMMIVVAGLLHWYFYMRKGQGKRLKFDRRDQAKGNRLWNFSDQVLDNMFWSLGSGVAQLTAFQVLIMWAMANGYAPTITFAENPVWFVLALLLLPVWSAFHFYWVHRLLHVPFLYNHVHSLHHRNVNVGPWSGLSMHPVEHLMYFGTVFVHFAIASHPVHVIFHLMFYALYAVTTHTGFEGLWFRNKKRVHLGMFHHQIHHRYFECNYGNLDVPWDKLFGSFHDGTDTGKEVLRNTKKH